MAGRGNVAPKDPGHRRRYNQPARGEWVDLQPLKKAVLPPHGIVKIGPESVRKDMWDAWRRDPVGAQYSPSDLAAICELGRRYYEFSHGEQRLRMDELGLTPKGRRDLRWRNPAEAASMEKANVKAAEVRRLHLAKEPAP